MTSSETQFIQQTYRRPYPSPTPKSADGDQKNSADPYDAFIWELARKFTNSEEEAEAAVQEMRSDIQRCEQGSVNEQPIKHRLTALIALRRLIGFLQ